MEIKYEYKGPDGLSHNKPPKGYINISSIIDKKDYLQNITDIERARSIAYEKILKETSIKEILRLNNIIRALDILNDQLIMDKELKESIENESND